MSQPAFAAAVLIGRFQPFHNGHAALLAKALASAPRVIVILGSAHAARNARNPFSWEERAAMIGGTLDAAARARVSFLPLRDCYDDARWAGEVTRLVDTALGGKARIALVGYLKDASSQYLQRFPEWSLLDMAEQGGIDASSLRRLWFAGEAAAATWEQLAPLVPAPVLDYLRAWSALPHFAALRAEHLALEESRRIWGSGPFITVDAVVRAAGQVLLIRRGRPPGQGLWALPGGFLDGRERVLQGAIRELREETGIGLADAELEAALAGRAVFDHPDRSARGRTITHAHFFDLPLAVTPPVAGADDAAEARWVAVDQLAAWEGLMFEDHFNILDHFLGLLP